MYALRIFITAFYAFFCSALLAQQVPIVAGPLLDAKHIQYGVFGNDQTCFYAARTNTDVAKVKHLLIEKYDKTTLKLVSSTELKKYSEVREESKGGDGISCFLIKDKVYCFYKFFDKKAGRLNVLLQTIDAAGVVSDIYNVLETETRTPMLDYQVKFSPDQESFCILIGTDANYFISQSLVINFGQSYGLRNCKLYKTSTLGLIWEKDISKYAGNGACLIIDNAGSLYFLDKQEKKYVLSVLTANSPTLKQLPELVDATLRVESAQLFINQKGELVFAGIDAEDIQDVKGIYRDPSVFLRILNPATLAVIGSYEYPFNSDVTDKFSSGQAFKKIPPEQLKMITTKPYNEFIPFTVIESADAYYFYTMDVYHDIYELVEQTKDIVVGKIFKTGDLKYMNAIPYFVGGVFAVTPDVFLANGQLHLLMMEDPSLGDKKLEEYESLTMPYAPFYNSNDVMVTVSDDGTMTKKIFFVNKKREMMYSKFFKEAFPYDGNKLMLSLQDTRANEEQYACYQVD